MQISRRGLLAGAAAGGGLVVAWYFYPREFSQPLEPGRGEQAFGAWLKIARDGVVTVAVPQLEMGQGITTLLPQIVAVELGADWRQVAVEPAPISGAYANVPLAKEWAPLWLPTAPGLADQGEDLLARRFAEENRFSVTADGTSLAAYEAPCRIAGASARAMLAMAAAAQWDVPWEECESGNGFISHGEKRASFGELAEAAALMEPPDPPVLRPEPAAESPIPGEADAETAFPRLDLPAKVDGSYLFAGDIRLPDMVYAAIRHGPIDKAELTRFDPAKIGGNARLIGLVDGERWLAAVASDWWSAEQVLGKLAPVFRVTGPVSSADIDAALEDGSANGLGQRIATRGEPDEALINPDLTLEYRVAPALHAGIETATATARLLDGRLELWLASQAPEAARQAAADAAGVSLADTVLYPMPAGGSFDARLEHEHAVEVAKIAREIGRPVQLIWSRWQEQLRTIPRPPAISTMTAKLGPQGEIRALKNRITMPSATRQFGERLFGGKTRWAAIAESEGLADPLSLEGAMPPYAIPEVAIDHVPVRIGLPTGRMRGNGHALTAFFTECFIDEVAKQKNREPLSFRIEMLGSDLRLVECLQRAARQGDWGGGGEESGQGLACHRMGDAEAGPNSGGRIACVATARRGEGGVRVEKLSVAVDIGRIVNLDIARQQIEGGLIFGMGLALGSSTEYEQGLPLSGRLSEMNLPTLSDSPELQVDFIASQAEPFDPGELGVAVVAPAIANALFSATGLRLRQLPLFSEGL